ncbi:hypothetical protein ASPCADRAFT_133277 [Aspergillus carbonarius ITEM 5010]|uniref:Uncharacterized protein n=1 Tax=Aspergillus carbonarius (strain ITEM 5010) TaxID=602072 RepID=A0A1R3REI0_ASPC5|nr:hypothetical protein ASPCADRAFT_133277 [Aspergillus carbonarius ITEM 5010]
MFGNGLMSWLRPSAETAVPESKWDPATLTMHLRVRLTCRPSTSLRSNRTLENQCSCRSAVAVRERMSVVEYALDSAVSSVVNAAVAAMTVPLDLRDLLDLRE